MKKILFNDKYGLTQAVLDGRKTQTRRIMKGKPLYPDDEIIGAGVVGDVVQIIANGGVSCIMLKLPYKLGEVVAVAQSYKDCGNYHVPKEHPGWNNKLFAAALLMPYRIRITNVRVERLQDISDEDCFAEGIIKEWHAPACRNYYYIPNVVVKRKDDVYDTPRDAYAALIDKISGKGTFASNPFVFVYDFELVKE